MKQLSRGYRGDEVRLLQEFLNSRGYSVGAADGIFGPKTEIALQRWQLNNDLDADGIFGPRSLEAALKQGFSIPAGTFAGKGRMEISERGIAFIHGFETLRLDCYDDGFGYPTIGWGHLVKKGEPWKIGDRITKAEADALFKQDLKVFEDAVNEAVTRPMSQGQYDAFVSLAFNIGAGAFKGSSAVKLFNAGKIHQAADAILKWNKVKGKVVRGLTRRREGERELFLS